MIRRLTLGLIILLFAYFGYKSLNQKGDEKVLSSVEIETLLKDGAVSLSRYFVSTKFTRFLQENTQACPEIIKYQDNVYEEFYRCLPAALFCLESYFKRENLGWEVERKNRAYSLDFTVARGRSDKADKRFLQATLSYQDQMLTFLLNTDCRERELPKDIYSWGEIEAYEDMKLWDNHDNPLRVDIFPVSKGEVQVFKAKEKFNPSEYALPDLSLTLEEKREYCLSQGKVLLKGHVFDTLSSYRDGTKFSGVYVRGETPWTYDRSRSFLANDEFSAKDCQKLYSKECKNENINRVYFHSTNRNWTGVYQIWGGDFEVFDKSFDGPASAKTATDFFSFKSKAFSIGSRVEVEEEKFVLTNNDDLESLNQLGSVPMSFRCMRY